MAVFEHTLNTGGQRRFLASNEVSWEASTHCVLFEAGSTPEGRAYLHAEKITDLASIDLTEWVFTPHYVAPFGIYGTFLKGLEWHPFPSAQRQA